MLPAHYLGVFSFNFNPVHRAPRSRQLLLCVVFSSARTLRLTGNMAHEMRADKKMVICVQMGLERSLLRLAASVGFASRSWRLGASLLTPRARVTIAMSLFPLYNSPLRGKF